MNIAYIKVINAISLVCKIEHVRIYSAFNCDFIRVPLRNGSTLKFTFKHNILSSISIYQGTNHYDLRNEDGWVRYGGFSIQKVNFSQDEFLIEAMAPYCAILKQFFPRHHDF